MLLGGAAVKKRATEKLSVDVIRVCDGSVEFRDNSTGERFMLGADPVALAFLCKLDTATIEAVTCRTPTGISGGRVLTIETSNGIKQH